MLRNAENDSQPFDALMHGEADQRHRADALPDRASMDVAADQPVS
jgi:hypothetical protein